ncbi:MAG: hypothetical protein IJH39_09320, partial [Clostridia bacterium]|nr:hypothetical protein [Clostridia bacterium]
MNVYEFEQVKEKLIECDLINYISNLTKWFNRLTKKHIDNFLDLKYHESLKKYAKLLVNINFLGSDNYLSDVEELKKVKKENIKFYDLYNFLTDPNFISSKYHRK